MSARRRFVLATGNRGKFLELSALLHASGLDFELAAPSELGVASPPETGATFVENALLKARHAARVTGLPAIADDSGLVVPALGGAPGVHSARFAGEQAADADNVAKLLKLLADPELDRSARFHCVLVALERPDDPAPLLASGAWAGRIAREPRGSGGFGYDPVFEDGSGRTAAELEPAEKNRKSHRAAALNALLGLLRER